MAIPRATSSRVRVADVAHRYRAWQELLDVSTQLALAGLRAQGFSAAEAWEAWCQRWARAARGHQRASRRVAQRLHARDKDLTP